ncbi:MAG: biotin transporter BioY [Epulopiscium sp.]|nr:biotin transporter BioY [Candidatus Epulonipiscium sp.]
MKTKDLVLISLFAAITCILSVIAIPLPFTPVPITLQILAVTMCGAILGGKGGALSQVIYVLLGAIGLPVYAGGASGLGQLMGPTGGYLFGFIIGAYLIGILTHRGMKSVTTRQGRYGIIVGSMLVGLFVIYLCGMFQLMLVAQMTLAKAFLGGVAPFILVDMLKVIAGSIIAFALRESLVKAAVIS